MRGLEPKTACKDLGSDSRDVVAQMTLNTCLTEQTTTSTARPTMSNVPNKANPAGLRIVPSPDAPSLLVQTIEEGMLITKVFFSFELIENNDTTRINYGDGAVHS